MNLDFIVGASNISLFLSAEFDLSSATELEIKFVSPGGLVKFTRTQSAGEVSAPAVDSPVIPGVPTSPFAANMYALYVILADDFTEGGDGEWNVCLTYTDTVTTPPTVLIGTGTLSIGPDC